VIAVIRTLFWVVLPRALALLIFFSTPAGA
jgi:hypothetical protein